MKKTLIMLITVIMLLSVVPVAAASGLELSARPKGNDIDTYEIALDGQVVMRYRTIQGYSAWQRTRIIIDRITRFAAEGDLRSSSVTAGEVNGMPVVLVNGQLLATVTAVDWEANQSTPAGLVSVWAENIRQAISASSIVDSGNLTSGENVVSGDSPQQQSETVDAAQVEKKMLSLINEARRQAGVAPLIMDNALVNIARLKSQDMINKNYFAHQSPTYGSPFDMMRQYGIEYRYAAENLAGAPDVDTAHVNLMKSPGHRANILNPNYTHVGIGVVSGGPYGKMITQMFISK